MAALGCPSVMAAAVYPRGGSRRSPVAVVQKLISAAWNRKLDAVSDAQVVFGTANNPQCCAGLQDVDAWSHELHLYRDKVKVWEGPITRITDNRGDGTFRIEALDMMGWLDRRILHAGYSYVGRPTDLAVIAKEVIRTAFAPDDPNASRWAQILSNSGVLQERIVEPESSIALDDIQEMAEQGLNYTVVGRNIFLFGDSISIGDLAVVNDDMFTASAPITKDGSAMLTAATVVGNNSVVGSFGSVDPTYGLHETLLNVNEISDASSASATARAAVLGMSPPPVIINTDNLGVLRPSARIDIQQLVPGVTATYGAQGNCIAFQQRLRLEQIQVNWQRNTEQVKPVFALIMGIGR